MPSWLPWNRPASRIMTRRVQGRCLARELGMSGCAHRWGNRCRIHLVTLGDSISPPDRSERCRRGGTFISCTSITGKFCRRLHPGPAPAPTSPGLVSHQGPCPKLEGMVVGGCPASVGPLEWCRSSSGRVCGSDVPSVMAQLIKMKKCKAAYLGESHSSVSEPGGL